MLTQQTPPTPNPGERLGREEGGVDQKPENKLLPSKGDSI